MKKIYLAASWIRQLEISSIAHELRNIGVDVISSWIDETGEDPIVGKRKRLTENAIRDLSEVRACDVFVRFADVLVGLVPATLATGGRMVEMGVALALGKPVYLVGFEQNIFDHLPQIIHVKDVGHLKRELSPVEVN